MKQATKTSGPRRARLVTKAFSVVSNRFSIRERSVFWGARGARGGRRARIVFYIGGRRERAANGSAPSRAQSAAATGECRSLALTARRARSALCFLCPHDSHRKNKRTFWITCDAKGLRMRARRTYLFIPSVQRCREIWCHKCTPMQRDAICNASRLIYDPIIQYAA